MLLFSAVCYACDVFAMSGGCMVKLTSDQIERWVSKYFDFTRRSNGELLIRNPFYHNDNPKLNISVRDKVRGDKIIRAGAVHDWRTSKYDMSFIKFVQLYRKIKFYEAIKEVCGESTDIRSIMYEGVTKEKVDQPIRRIELPKGCHNVIGDKPTTQSTIARSYLNRRCVSDTDIEKYNIQYSGGSVVFPYYEFGELCYWQCREILNKKFLFPDAAVYGVGKEEFLYGFDDIEHGCDIIITESIFNKLSIGTNALASGGAILQDRQKRKLRILNPSRIILAPDIDSAGVASINYNYDVIGSAFPNKVWYCLPPSNIEYGGKSHSIKDWNEFAQVYGDYNNSRIYDYIIENAKVCDIRSRVVLHRLAKNTK